MVIRWLILRLHIVIRSLSTLSMVIRWLMLKLSGILGCYDYAVNGYKVVDIESTHGYKVVMYIL